MIWIAYTLYGLVLVRTNFWVDATSKQNYFLVQTILSWFFLGQAQFDMLTAAVKNSVSKKGGAAENDARVLSLAETVGNMGHWHWHIQTDSLSWSDQVFSIFGQDQESYQPNFERFITAFYDVDRSRVRDCLEQSVREPANFEFDARIVTPSAELRNVIIKGQPECDDDGQVIAMFGIVTDVTDAFRTLQAVRDQKEMLDLAARVSGLGHWVWDPDQGYLAFCSDHLSHMFETTVDLLKKKISHPGDFST